MRPSHVRRVRILSLRPVAGCCRPNASATCLKWSCDHHTFHVRLGWADWHMAPGATISPSLDPGQHSGQISRGQNVGFGDPHSVTGASHVCPRSKRPGSIPQALPHSTFNAQPDARRVGYVYGKVSSSERNLLANTIRLFLLTCPIVPEEPGDPLEAHVYELDTVDVTLSKHHCPPSD